MASTIATATTEQRSEWSKRGAETRRKNTEHKRQLREAAVAILTARCPEGSQAFDTLIQLGIKDPTCADLLVLAQFDKACKGSTEAAKFLRDTAGEKPELIIAAPKYDSDASPDALKGMTDEQLQEWIDQRNEETQGDGTATEQTDEVEYEQTTILDADFEPI